MPSTHTFTTSLWAMKGEGGWVFVTMPQAESDAVRSVPRPPRPGFGSIRVSATIGSTTWKTSIFPEAKSGCYVLPVKRAVRDAQGVEVPDEVTVRVEVLE